jgi:hypothetical protein
VVLGIYLLMGGADPEGSGKGPEGSGEGPEGSGEDPEGSGEDQEAGESFFPLLSSVNVDFFKMTLPGQRLTVISKKDYFRFDKLKCHVELQDAKGELVAKGIFSGFLKKIVI